MVEALSSQEIAKTMYTRFLEATANNAFPALDCLRIKGVCLKCNTTGDIFKFTPDHKGYCIHCLTWGSAPPTLDMPEDRGIEAVCQITSLLARRGMGYLFESRIH